MSVLSVKSSRRRSLDYSDHPIPEVKRLGAYRGDATVTLDWLSLSKIALTP